MDQRNQARQGTNAGKATTRFVNTGHGPTLQLLDIRHPEYFAVVDPDTAFWSLLKADKLAKSMTDDQLLGLLRPKAETFAEEMRRLRFGLQPSALYFNPTEQCNLNCCYCYLPEEKRRQGQHMPRGRLLEALSRLERYFERHLPAGTLPQIVFHGAEPLLNREAVFAGIEQYGGRFHFGIQTNATLLDETAVGFLTRHRVSVGISLDASVAEIADHTRKDWRGQGVFDKVIRSMDLLQGYAGWSVICTVNRRNMSDLTRFVDFLHQREVPTCLMNPVRCSLPNSREVKPGDAEAARHFLSALDRTFELYQQTGRKLPVANFANVLLAIVAPTARRLMCDISPCGGGRCFFALAANGDLFPCSEFIGLPSFRGGNLFEDDIDAVLGSPPFRAVAGRKAEDILPCRHCAIRHFCGSPCPAEAYAMNGSMNQPGAFCEFYEEQVRYAFRLIADGKHDAYLWDGWDEDLQTTLSERPIDKCARLET